MLRADAANNARLWARVKVFLWSVPGAGLPLLAAEPRHTADNDNPPGLG